MKKLFFIKIVYEKNLSWIDSLFNFVSRFALTHPQYRCKQEVRIPVSPLLPRPLKK